ncbi:hypothetical protein AB0L99_05385 [Streptomyces sp. NPDC051954]|uniref:hypothetical protein n=1 Tax=Streptomyces sp. NPDC051954 TaxID=3155524 RepID=UPI003438480E
MPRAAAQSQACGKPVLGESSAIAAKRTATERAACHDEQVIILDTNQLESLKPPNGPVLRILSKLANATGNGLALPEMVMVEHLAHRRNKVNTLQDNLRKAVDAISAEVADTRFATGLSM